MHHLLPPPLPLNEVLHHPRTQWAGAVEREHRDHVFNMIGLKLLEVALHPIRLHLEEALHIARSENLEDFRVIQRYRVHVRTGTGEALDVVQGLLDNVERLQPKEVELDEPEHLGPVHVH